MLYHMCCNQAEHRWEIRDINEKVIFEGNLKEVKEEFNKYRIIEELDKLETILNVK